MRVRLPHWAPFVRGDDGLTYCERRLMARRYQRTAGARPTLEEIQALRRLLEDAPAVRRLQRGGK